MKRYLLALLLLGCAGDDVELRRCQEMHATERSIAQACMQSLTDLCAGNGGCFCEQARRVWELREGRAVSAVKYSLRAIEQNVAQGNPLRDLYSLPLDIVQAFVAAVRAAKREERIRDELRSSPPPDAVLWHARLEEAVRERRAALARFVE